ncbi:MFS transporter [Metabacillus sp. GX 13764]|uniref:CynX/NimT family MFS transporter n=1 Tax=Metabacillus kandeliae TaxID=2900151 RepID=UPI001E2F2182|nr:MFS transporter [Metabacillus kandeliae]MCD7034397.1 MFS transporter [Metabacillus kandeliae]
MLLVLGIIFVGANLRAPLTSVGPLVGFIKEDLGISNTLAGILTTLPLIAFALLSPFAPRLARRYGIEAVLLAAMGLLTVGIVLRSLAGEGALFTGTACVGLAIAVCNVLMPSIIKQKFPAKVGVMTGVYSVSMNLSGAVASGLSVPIGTSLGLGWHGALGVWGVLAFVSMLLWLPQMKNRRKQEKAVQSQTSENVNLWRSPLAWQITLFMGLQSMVFYIIVAWLPEILEQRGLASGQAGWTLSLVQFSLLPFTFAVPILAGKMKSQTPLVAITGVLFLGGTTGLLLGSTALIPVWVMMIGIAGGSAFSLAMMFFSLRTSSGHQAAELSGMAQSIGYLLASIGPTLFGFLHDQTNGWNVPLGLLIAISALILFFGIGAGKNRKIVNGK